MKIIERNPYRIIGLLVGATASEQDRQARTLKQLIEAEEEPPEDFSFPPLGNLTRTVDSITDAVSKLNLDSDKMSAALFWFYNGSLADEPAFNAINEGKINEAVDIWQKRTTTESKEDVTKRNAAEVSERNASAFSNLSTLYLSGVIKNSNTNESAIENGIYLKLEFLKSDFARNLTSLATDETYKTTKEELQLLFLNQLQFEIERSGIITTTQFIEIILKQSFSAKVDFFKKFISKPIAQIDKEITETEEKRKNNEANAAKFGNELYNKTISSLKLLTKIISLLDSKKKSASKKKSDSEQKFNSKLISISDKLADEILNCSIAYFNHFFKAGLDVEKEVMPLAMKAKSIALGSVIKDQIEENISNYQKYIEHKEEEKKVTNDLNFIKSKLDAQGLKKTIANAKNLADSCKPKLTSLKLVLGADLYETISSAVVNKVMGMIIDVVNDEQTKFVNQIDRLQQQSLPDLYHLDTIRQELFAVITDALIVAANLAKWDMDNETRTRYDSNRSQLASLVIQLGISQSTDNPTPTNKPSGSTKSSSRKSSKSYKLWCIWAIIIGIIIFLIIVSQNL